MFLFLSFFLSRFVCVCVCKFPLALPLITKTNSPFSSNLSIQLLPLTTHLHYTETSDRKRAIYGGTRLAKEVQWKGWREGREGQRKGGARDGRLGKSVGTQRDRRQVHKLSGDEKTTEEQLNNATSPHSSVPYRFLLPTGCLEWLDDNIVAEIYIECKIKFSSKHCRWTAHCNRV